MIPRKRGPKPTGKGVPVMTRFQPELLEALDRFIAEATPSASRPEALRIAFRDWAIAHGYLELPPDREDAN
jgi:hypothetical protein